ncbi:ubiquinone biosynthesis accessory factor UbiJ [Zooshikella sp. RANM57]|uniref:ubiquinone biosynthesis accessory factor UbiJ n=1 Tax=Zooshikella sp. RANM57 TaxID=3425863 RepID=UPI003D6EB0AB
MSITVNTALYAAMEKVVNELLALDPLTQQRLAHFSGETLCIQSTQPKLTFYISFTLQGVNLHSHHESNLTACITGEGVDLLRLLLHKSTADNTLHERLQLAGNTDFIMAIHHTIQESELDWEAMVAKLIGPLLAHKVTNGLKSGLHWLQYTRLTLQQNITEYLQEELRELPPRNAVEIFQEDLAQLQSDTEQLEYRLARLQQQFKNAPQQD